MHIYKVLKKQTLGTVKWC